MPIDFTSLPKTELHAHLEGSIPVEALYELVKKHKRLDEAPTLDDVRRRYEFDDFAHFLDVYKWTVSMLKHADDQSVGDVNRVVATDQGYQLLAVVPVGSDAGPYRLESDGRALSALPLPS